VPAWNSPGRPYVVEQLACGQMVSVLGVESFVTGHQYSERPQQYVKIQLADQTAYVDAKNVRLSKSQEPLSANPPQSETAAKQDIRIDEEQKKWNALTKDDVTLREEALLNPKYKNGPRTFTANISNNSSFAVSHLQLLVRLYDCEGKPKSDASNCEIIGEVKPIAAISVPSGQTRRLTAMAPFEATPRPKGKFAWDYKILGVRVE
jgi:hypothetical protein